jgi:hypothetical protein
MDEAKKLSYPERVKLGNEWNRYCAVTNNKAQTVPQFIEWLQTIKGLRLTPAKQTVIAAGESKVE